MTVPSLEEEACQANFKSTRRKAANFPLDMMWFLEKKRQGPEVGPLKNLVSEVIQAGV